MIKALCCLVLLIGIFIGIGLTMLRSQYTSQTKKNLMIGRMKNGRIHRNHDRRNHFCT